MTEDEAIKEEVSVIRSALDNPISNGNYATRISDENECMEITRDGLDITTPYMQGDRHLVLRAKFEWTWE